MDLWGHSLPPSVEVTRKGFLVTDSDAVVLVIIVMFIYCLAKAGADTPKENK